jgi:hypothetical protein
MKIQLFSLLIIITLTNCDGIRFSSIDDGACASNTKYTFKITGESDVTVTQDIATAITFETPENPLCTCTNDAISTANDNTKFVLNCEITSAISDTAIKITGIVLGEGGSAITATFVVDGQSALSISTEAVTCPLNSFTVTGKTDGSCENNEYSFTVKGTLGIATSSETTWTPTFSVPSSPTATCTMPAAGTSANAAVITCTITSAFSNSDITLTGLTAEGFDDVTVGDSYKGIATGKTCEGLNNFEFGSKTEGSCNNNEYSFTVTGTVTKATSSVTTWTPTFSAPTNPTATCSMPAATTEANNAVITCKITSALSNSAITLTKLVADGFNDVTIASPNQAIATGKTCAGTTTTNPSNPSNDGSKFISLNAMLFLFFLLIF